MNTLSHRLGFSPTKLLIVAGMLVAAAILMFSVANKPEEISAYPDSRVLRTAMQDGISYKLADDGNVFRVIDERGTWTWVDRIFDPDEMARQFIRDGEGWMVVDLESGQRYPLSKHFEDSFEGVAEGVDGLRSLIGEERKWTEFTLQSPETPEVPDYVALRTRILKEHASFLDASVAPSQLHSHTGEQSLRCVCPAKTSRMICTKASIGTSLIGFEQDDDVWFQAWFLIDGATRPMTLADLEGRHVKQSPGLRLMLFEGEYLGVELKALDKPKYQQSAESRVSFPIDRWVQVTMHAYLHPDRGHVQIWQDETLVVDEHGPTLPFAGMLYNNLEVGISAHAYGDKSAELYVDDILITTTPLRDIKQE